MAQDVAALLAQALKLFDPSTFDRDKIHASRRKAQALLETAIAAEPDNVAALYYLAWGLVTDRAPEADTGSRLRDLSSKILGLTREVKVEASSNPSVDARARSLALAWDLPERASSVMSVADGENLVALAREAKTLRDTPWSQRAVRAAEAALVYGRAREANAIDEAYAWLLAWVETHPLHTSYIAKYDGNDLTLAAGLEPFFEDAGFVAWARDQPVHARIAPEHHARAVALAAGWDRLKHGGNQYEPPAFGRLGRLLALRALGAPLAARVTRQMGPGEWNTVEIAAQASPGLLPRLVELGLSLDEGIDGTPPIAALTGWGALDAVQALLDAGADRDAKDEQGQTALDVARKNKSARALKMLGAKRPAGGIDTKPVRATLAKMGPKLLACSWAQRGGVTDLGEIEKFLETVDATGAKSWNEAASLLDRIDPASRLMLALVLREALPPAKPTKLAKLESEEPRVVLGDIVVKGELLLDAEWLVTGSVTCARYGDGEASSLSVAGRMQARYVYTEGELWIEDDLEADVLWAEYEAGQLVVGKTLTSQLFIHGRHGVTAEKISANETIKLESTERSSCGTHFPDAAFDRDALSSSKLWKLIAAGTFPNRGGAPG